MGIWSCEPDGNDTVADWHYDLFDESFEKKIINALNDKDELLIRGAAHILTVLEDSGLFGVHFELSTYRLAMEKLLSIDISNWDEEWKNSIKMQVEKIKKIVEQYEQFEDPTLRIVKS